MPEIDFVFNKPWISFQECVHLDLTVPMCFPTAISKDAGFSLETHLKKFFPTFFLTLSHVFLGHLFCPAITWGIDYTEKKRTDQD